MTKLLVINDNPIYVDGSNYYSLHSFVFFPRYLSDFCERVTLWAPLAPLQNCRHQMSELSRLDLGNMQIESREYFESFYDYLKMWPAFSKAWRNSLDRLVAAHDAVVIRIPSPAIGMVTKSTIRFRKPLIFVVGANIVTQAESVLKNRGLKRLLYRAAAALIANWQERKAHHAKIIYVYSKELMGRFAKSGVPTRLMQDPHISLSSFATRTDTCSSDKIRILRACWLTPSKGIECLLQAIGLLLERGYEVNLDLVGKELTKGYLSHLRKEVDNLQLSDRVAFRGWVAFHRMPEEYSSHDIQVISSLAEGAPRCIVEGAARGLPLVSTTSGGCRDFLKNEVDALLIPPNDPSAMAKAIQRLITDSDLRRKLISNGYLLAKNYSFEVMGERFLQEVTEVI